jgi:3-hydroxybutyryl-CoA dehydrogenase
MASTEASGAARGPRAAPTYCPVTSVSMSIKRVGIVGSGIMGAGIAETAAVSGFEVVLRSRNQSTADATLAALEKSLNRQVEKEKITEGDRDAALARVTGTSDLSALKDVDLVIESVVEDLEVKKELFNELDRITADGTILATNTSTLPVIELAMQTGRPDKVCGVHFFNPAPVMALVEVVRPLTASDETVAAARQFAEACGKSPVEVKDQAGFIVNALLFPYLNNAVRMCEGGVASVADIDTAMKGGCGFPMGPFALLDLVGLDTSVAILDALYEEYRDPNYATVPLLRRMVAAELLGRKSGRGFFDYRK